MVAFKSMFIATVIATVAATKPVPLGSASNFAILTKSSISMVPSSMVKGNIGVSPIASTAMTGFGLTVDPSNAFSVSMQIKGRAFAANYAVPTPAYMTNAIHNMEAAYTDAAGRALSSAANLNINSGLISGVTFKKGVYNWGSDVMFSSDIYIKGSSSDIFIFQSTGNIIVGSGTKVILVDDGTGNGSPKASNIVWQLAGYVDVGTTSHLEGIFLVKTHAVFKTGSSLNGKILSQTACTLDSATIIDPTIEGKAMMEEPSTGDDEKMKDPSTGDGGNMKDPSTGDGENMKRPTTGGDANTNEPLPVDGVPKAPAAVKTYNQ